MGLLASKPLYQLESWRLQGEIEELTEMQYNGYFLKNYRGVGVGMCRTTFSLAGPHIVNTARGLTNYTGGNNPQGDYHTYAGTVKVLAEAGKLSHMRKVEMWIGPEQCSPTAARTSGMSFFECLFKLMDIEGSSTAVLPVLQQCKVQQSKKKEKNSCIRMEEGSLGRRGADEPTLVGVNVHILRDSNHNGICQEIELSPILGLNARYTEVDISTSAFIVSSPPPLLLSDALLAGGRFDLITKLLLRSTNKASPATQSSDARNSGASKESMREACKCWTPFPAREWAELITRLFSVCGALKKLIVEVDFCYFWEFYSVGYTAEVADRYWAAIDAMAAELRASSGGGSDGGGPVGTGTVEVRLDLNIPVELLMKVRHDHPIFRGGDFLQIISYDDYATYHHGLVIREGRTRGVREEGGPSEEEGEEKDQEGGIVAQGSMVVAWYLHLTGLDPPGSAYLCWTRWRRQKRRTRRRGRRTVSDFQQQRRPPRRR